MGIANSPYCSNNWLSRRADRYVKSRKTRLPALWWALVADRSVIQPMMTAWRDSVKEWEQNISTDPYGELEFAVGSADDFVCFDYVYQPGNSVLILHAVVNSETGCFIQNFRTPQAIVTDDPELAYDEACYLVDEALEWCDYGEVDHDYEGWNQDPLYFARAVKCAVDRDCSWTTVKRNVMEMENVL